MTPEQRSIVKASWLKLSAYYQVQLQDHVFEMYAQDVEDLDFMAVQNALVDYRRNPKNTRVPLPAAIRALIRPSIDDDALARDVASRIVEAVVRFDYTYPAEAKAHVGPIGWRIVERHGGWERLCASIDTTDTGTFMAQTRDLAKSMIVMARAGKSDTPPQLPEGPVPNRELSGVMKILGTVKSLEGEGK